MSPYRFHVPFDQVDADGLLSLPHLFTWAHRAYEAFMQEIGFGLGGLLQEGNYLLPLAHASADCHAPLKLADQVEVVLTVSKIGRTSFTLEYRFLSGKGLCARVITTHVWIHRGEGRPCPLPKRLKESLSA
jgi:acyl-CoA thioesterase FadM